MLTGISHTFVCMLSLWTRGSFKTFLELKKIETQNRNTELTFISAHKSFIFFRTSAFGLTDSCARIIGPISATSIKHLSESHESDVEFWELTELRNSVKIMKKIHRFFISDLEFKLSFLKNDKNLWNLQRNKLETTRR